MRGLWPQVVVVALLVHPLPGCEDDCKDYLGPVLYASDVDECGAKMETLDDSLCWPDSERSSFEFSRLRHVRGSLVISSSERLESISFPALERVDGDVRILGNAILRAVAMPQLRRARSLQLSDDPALATFSLEQLSSLETSLTVRDVALTRLDLPAL